MNMLAFRCSICGADDHPPMFCTALPQDARQRLAGDQVRVPLEWGDTVVVWTSIDANEEAVFVGVRDGDTGDEATASLNVDEAARLGAELTTAAYVKRSQRA